VVAFLDIGQGGYSSNGAVVGAPEYNPVTMFENMGYVLSRIVQRQCTILYGAPKYFFPEMELLDSNLTKARVFCSMLFTVPVTYCGFYFLHRKTRQKNPYKKIHTKKSAEQEKSLYIKNILQDGKTKTRIEKHTNRAWEDSGLCPASPQKMPFKNSVSGH
jgi:hypothetical protein